MTAEIGLNLTDVIVLTTGGTIDKVYTLGGQLEIGAPAAARLLEIGRAGPRVEAVMAKDSLDLTDADRAQARSTDATR